MKHLIPFLMIALVRIHHSLITIFADISEGGGLSVILREDGDAILREDGSYFVRET